MTVGIAWHFPAWWGIQYSGFICYCRKFSILHSHMPMRLKSCWSQALMRSKTRERLMQKQHWKSWHFLVQPGCTRMSTTSSTAINYSDWIDCCLVPNLSIVWSSSLIASITVHVFRFFCCFSMQCYNHYLGWTWMITSKHPYHFTIGEVVYDSCFYCTQLSWLAIAFSL